MDIKKTAGVVIVLIAVIEMGFLICGGGIWINELDLSSTKHKSTSTEVEGKSFDIKAKDKIEGIDGIDTDEIFNSTYFNALSILSEGVAYGTSWLKLCPNSQIEIGSHMYSEVCDDNYTSVESVKKPLQKYITKAFVNYFVDDNYINYNGKLYVRTVSVSKDETYVEFVDYKVTSLSETKITYSVGSKYSELNCGNDCDYTYQNHVFELTKEGNNWLVSNMEMPY